MKKWELIWRKGTQFMPMLSDQTSFLDGMIALFDPSHRVRTHSVHPNLIAGWKRQAIDMAGVFDGKTGEREQGRETEVRELHAKIGQLESRVKPSAPRFCP